MIQPKKVLIVIVRIACVHLLYYTVCIGVSAHHTESDSGFESSSHPTCSISGRLSTLSHHTDSTGIVIPDGLSDNEEGQALKVCQYAVYIAQLYMHNACM